jgi:hypothetical protein
MSPHWRRSHAKWLETSRRVIEVASKDDGRRSIAQLLDLATVAVAVGNRTESNLSRGTMDYDESAEYVLAVGARPTTINKGNEILVAPLDQRVKVLSLHVKVHCDLGAGDAFVSGNDKGIGIEDLTISENHKFLEPLAARRTPHPGLDDAVRFVAVPAALPRSVGSDRCEELSAMEAA